MANKLSEKDLAAFLKNFAGTKKAPGATITEATEKSGLGSRSTVSTRVNRLAKEGVLAKLKGDDGEYVKRLGEGAKKPAFVYIVAEGK